MSTKKDIILPAGVSKVSGGGVGTSVVCSECGDQYTKVMSGLNICGTCQVTWAIKMFWMETQLFRWGIKRFNVTMHEDGSATYERITHNWERARPERVSGDGEGLAEDVGGI